MLATLLRTSLGDIGRGVAAGTLARKPFDATPLVDQVAALGRIARRHGMHALDRSVIADRDVAAAVAEIVDGRHPTRSPVNSTNAAARVSSDHAAAADMRAGAAEIAPAMGMVVHFGRAGADVLGDDRSAAIGAGWRLPCSRRSMAR